MTPRNKIVQSQMRLGSAGTGVNDTKPQKRNPKMFIKEKMWAELLGNGSACAFKLGPCRLSELLDLYSFILT